MNKKKLLWVSASIIALAGLAYLGNYLYKKRRTTSQDPDKNNRKIIITKS
jgi:hypothetical protein